MCISLFSSLLVCRVCGLERYGPGTDIFTHYVDIMQNVCGLNGHYVLGPENMSNLQVNIWTFKTKAFDLFGNVQTSGMGTVKLHPLDHGCGDMDRIGVLYLNDAGIYEGSHKISKRHKIQHLSGLDHLWSTSFRSCNFVYQWLVDQKKKASFIWWRQLLQFIRFQTHRGSWEWHRSYGKAVHDPSCEIVNKNGETCRGTLCW